MKKLLEVTLGIVTGIGGFLEAGSIATSAQAGARFGYQLVWAIALGTVGLIVLTEMSGRLAAVSGRTFGDALRERFGINFFVIPLVVSLLVSYLVLASEIGGVSLALQLATGVASRWWAIPVALVGWLVLWKGTFGLVEKGSAILGLVTLAFIVAAFRLHTDWSAVAASLIPHRPTHDALNYWFVAVSILGASISPYLYFFYSSGAIEDGWGTGDLTINRIVSVLGMSFGGVLSIAVLIVAGLVFLPHGIEIERYEQIGLSLVPALGFAGFIFLLASLCVACLGSTLEISLSIAYLLAQGFGWRWSENAKPRDNARFSLTYTVAMLLAAVPIVLGVDLLKLTNIAMTLTAASLPVTILPLLVIMNDHTLLGEHRNRWASNVALAGLGALSIVLLVAALPLQLLGGG